MQQSVARPTDLPDPMGDDSATQARLAAIVETSADAIIGKDPDGIVTDWNAGAERLYGYTAVEAVGRPITMLAPPGREREIAELTARLRRGEAVPHHETRRRRKDGTLVDVSLVVTPIRDRSGRFVGSASVARDITEPQRAAALVAGQNRVLEQIVQGDPLPQVLDGLARLIEEQTGRALYASVLLLDEDGTRLRHGAAPGLPADYIAAIDGTAIGPNAGSCGTAAYRREPVIVADIATDPLWDDFRALALPHGLRACWSTPIMAADGRVLGTFALYYPERRGPTAAERQLVDLVTRTAAIAIARQRVDAEREQLLAGERQSREHLEVALDAGRMGAWDWDAVNGRVTWSLQLQRIHGLEPGTFGGTFEAYLADVHPDDRERVQATIAASLESGEHHLEYRIVWPDGSVHWVEARGRVVRHAGQPVGMRGVCMDVTADREAEEALRESEERFRTLADNIAQFAWMADASGWIFWYNRRWYEYTGTTLAEMEGWGWTKVHHPDHVDRVVAGISHCWETGTPWEDTFPLRGRDGQYRWFLSRALPIRDAAGTIVRWFGTNTDITAQREAEEERTRLLAAEQAARADAEAARAQAEAALRMRDSLVSFATHDLRTPLTMIKGQAQMLERLAARDRLSPEVLTSGLAGIGAASATIETLAGELLDTLRLEAGQQLDLRVQPTDLVELARRCAAEQQQTTDRHTIRVVARLRTLVGEWDATRLERVLTNLLTNAIKYSPEGGTVTVGVRRRRDEGRTWAELTVRDEGIGIAAADLPRIFERFHRSASVAGRIAGSGIGLAGAKQLIEQHGGTVAVESIEGRGSTFTVHLPVTATRAGGERPVQAPPGDLV